MADPGLLPLILVADDDPDDRLMMTEAFKERCQECRLLFAKDGAELLRVLEGKEPDLIILDLNMPLMDGREALRAIKTDPSLCHIPTVVMTTSENEDDVRFCYRAGASSYIIKPSSFSELLEIVSMLKSYWIDTVILPTEKGRHV